MSESNDNQTPIESLPNDDANATGGTDQAAPAPEEGEKSNSLKSRQSEANSGKSSSSNSSTGSQMNAKPSKSASTAQENTWNARIGFIGAGKMSECIVRGLLASARIGPKQLFVAAKSGRNLDTFKSQGIAVSTRSYDIFGKFDCDLIFIAVHGTVVRACFKQGGTRPLALTTNYIPTRRRQISVLSLVGGIPLADLKLTLLNPDNSESPRSRASAAAVEMHRAMLNCSVAYGLGLGALDVEVDSKKCCPLIRDTLQLLAKMECLPCEAQMDAVCALAGNGITFVYYFLSALADGGFKMGLSKASASKLATKMVQGAALAILETGKSPSQLRDESTSPSGPAVFGLALLDKRDCASGVQAAVEAAYRRVKELAE